MKNSIRDGLTYPTLTGRKLRRYVTVSIWIFVMLFVLSGYVVYLRWKTLAVVAGPDRPLANAAQITPLNKLAPTETPTPTLTPTVTATLPPDVTPSPTPTETPVPCPVDPQAWTLSDILPDDNFKRITPDCVYDGLARTVAWELLINSMGYTVPEVNEILGFAEAPRKLQPTIKAMTNTKGPMDIELSYSETWKGRFHPEYRTWQLDDAEQPAIAYTLRGCFRTSTIVGNERRVWGEYPVICVVSQDIMANWVFRRISEAQYAQGGYGAVRLFSLFGYQSEGVWVFLGSQKEPVTPFTDYAKMEEDRVFTAGLHNLRVWDSGWVETIFGLAMKPLPEGWQTKTNQADFDALQSIIKAFAQEQSSP